MKKLFYIIFLIFPIHLFSQAGSLDPTFGIDGKVKTCYTNAIWNFQSALDNNGRIICLGYINNQIGGNNVLRYNPDGSFDTTFGVGGYVYPYLSTILLDNVAYTTRGIHVFPDGKILLLTTTYGSPDLACWVIKLNSNGTLDTTFNGTGYSVLGFGSIYDRCYALGVQDDGKILVGGSSGPSAVLFAMARLNTDGSVDTSFGTNGRIFTSMSPNESGINTIAPLADGKIIVGGFTTDTGRNFALAKYNYDGTLDATFGTNGKINVPPIQPYRSDVFVKLVVKSDGKILVAGITNAGNESNAIYGTALMQFLPNGTIDASFGTNGITIPTTYPISDIALQTDNKIVGNVPGGAVLRVNANGTSLDTTFGTNGIKMCDDFLGSNSLLIQPDHKIVVTGVAFTEPDINGNLTQCSGLIRLESGILSNNEFWTKKLNLYPNPTSGIVSFDNSDNRFEKLEIYNYLGQNLFKKQLGNSNTENIDLSSFQSGVYLLKFKNTKGEISIEKIIKTD